MKLVIRQAEITDIDKMYSISCRAHQKYGALIPEACQSRFLRYYDTANKKHEKKYGLEMADHIQSSDWGVHVATLGAEVVGYTIAQREGGVVYKKGLFIDPNYQGRGIGEVLFQYSINQASKGYRVELLVICENTKAIRLYEKYGFRVTSTNTPTFYGARQQRMRRVTR